MEAFRVELGNGEWYSEKWYPGMVNSIQKTVKEKMGKREGNLSSK